jgi:predicted dehydrogenase
MGNWSGHFMDIIRWLMGEKASIAVSAYGGKFALNHDGDIPDTMHVTFEFVSGALVTFSIYEANSRPSFTEGEIELRGTKGTLYATEKGYKNIPATGGVFQT